MDAENLLKAGSERAGRNTANIARPDAGVRARDRTDSGDSQSKEWHRGQERSGALAEQRPSLLWQQG